MESKTNKNLPSITALTQIAWADLKVGALIGEGGYGAVYHGQWQGIQVAIKQLHLKKLAGSLLDDFKQEALLMAKCRFPYITELYGVCTETNHYAMVMAYVPKGSLYDVLHDANELLPWNPARWEIAIGIGKGLAYLHGQQIVHRDIKSLNVLLDNQYHAKLSDFGMAKLKLQSSSTSTQNKKGMGTTRWLAPELFKRGASPDFASDVYGYGMVLWEIASRKLPYEDAQNDTVAMGWIKDGEKENIPADCPVDYGQIIIESWVLPKERPTASEISTQLEKVKPKPQPTFEKMYAERSWHFDPQTKQGSKLEGKDYALLPATVKDIQKVIKFYQHHPVPGYDVGKVEVIYNPGFNRGFELHLRKLQRRDNNPAFVPKWSSMQDAGLRQKAHDLFIQLTQPYTDPDYPSVKLLPAWHGTKPAILDSLFSAGYANLATTDNGFFGKGYYSAYEAEYSHRVYSKGALILNWVASFSSLPVVNDDMKMLELEGKSNYGNHDAHFVPVKPKYPDNPNETVYYPCQSLDEQQYTEMVVFDSAALLPRYLVELQPELVKSISTFTPTSVGLDIPNTILTMELPEKPIVSSSIKQPLSIPQTLKIETSQESSKPEERTPIVVPTELPIESILTTQRQEKQNQVEFKVKPSSTVFQSSPNPFSPFFFSDVTAKPVALNSQKQEKQNQLVAACLKGDLSLLKQLESQGASFFYPNQKGLYPLVAAVYSCSLEMVRYIELELKDQADKQWSRVDVHKAKENLDRWTPMDLPWNATYGDLGNWYVKYQGATWCIYYDTECLKPDGFKEWGGWDIDNKPVVWEVGGEQCWGSNGARRQWHLVGSGRKIIMIRNPLHNGKCWHAGGRLLSPRLKVHDDVVKTIREQMNELRSEVESKAKQSSAPLQHQFLTAQNKPPRPQYQSQTSQHQLPAQNESFPLPTVKFEPKSQSKSTSIFSSPTFTSELVLSTEQQAKQNQLIAACLKGDLASVKQLESQGASFLYPNKEGLYPLVAAVYGCSLEMVRYVKSKLKGEAEKEKQWEQIDMNKAKSELDRWTPTELSKNVTYEELRKWYVKYQGASWCAYYDIECLKQHDYKNWGGWDGDYKEVIWIIGGEDLWSERGARARWLTERKFEEREEVGGLTKTIKEKKLVMDSFYGFLLSPSAKVHKDVVKTIREQMHEIRREVEAKVKLSSTPLFSLKV